MSNRGLYIIVGSVAVAIILFIVLFQTKSNQKEDSFKKTSWTVTYGKDSKDPYGTYLFYELMRHNTGNFITVQGDPSMLLKVKAETEAHDLLILFENKYDADSEFWKNLITYIDAGNSVLFIQEYDPIGLENYFNEVMLNNSSYREQETLHFPGESKKYTFGYLKEKETIGHSWSFFEWRDSIRFEQDSSDLSYYIINNQTNVKDLHIHELNENNQPVFVEFIYEGGSVYFYRTPVVFTNLYLIEEENVEHLEKVISKMDFDAVVYNLPEKVKKKNNNPKTPRVSPLQFVLKNQALRWAYFITIGGIILFFLFNLKRKQMAVPVLPPRQNTTLEFVDAVSKVYYQKHNNRNLVGHQYRIFTTFIRTRYHITINKNRQEYVRAIAARSGLEESDINEIVTTLDEQMKLSVVTDEQIIKLHKLIDKFYKYCK